MEDSTATQPPMASSSQSNTAPVLMASGFSVVTTSPLVARTLPKLFLLTIPVPLRSMTTSTMRTLSLSPPLSTLMTPATRSPVSKPEISLVILLAGSSPQPPGLCQDLSHKHPGAGSSHLAKSSLTDSQTVSTSTSSLRNSQASFSSLTNVQSLSYLLISKIYKKKCLIYHG